MASFFSTTTAAVVMAVVSCLVGGMGRTPRAPACYGGAAGGSGGEGFLGGPPDGRRGRGGVSSRGGGGRGGRDVGMSLGGRDGRRCFPAASWPRGELLGWGTMWGRGRDATTL